MPDKTAIGVSPELRQYIEALVEEVVLEGKLFENHKKYLGRFCAAEGLDQGTLEKNLSDFFDLLEEWGNLHTKASSMMAKILGQECFLSAPFIDKLLSDKEQVALKRQEKERLAKEQEEKRAKAEAARKAREEAEKKAEAERRAREAAARKAETERKAREEAEAARELARRKEELRKVIEENDKRIAELEEKVRLKRLREAQKNAADSQNLVHVKGGIFEYKGEGFIESRFSPIRTRVPSFNIGKTVITQEQWIQVMGSYSPGDSLYERFKGDRFPAIVKWNDAQRFIQRLNQKTGKKFKIPFESEWDYAALGGQDSRHYRYCGSNDYDKIAWRATGSLVLHEVGLKRPNELGLYDMCGNFAEWCESNWIVPGLFKGILKGFSGYDDIGNLDNDLSDNSDGFKSIWAREFALEDETVASFRLIELTPFAP